MKLQLFVGEYLSHQPITDPVGFANFWVSVCEAIINAKNTDALLNHLIMMYNVITNPRCSPDNLVGIIKHMHDPKNYDGIILLYTLQNSTVFEFALYSRFILATCIDNGDVGRLGGGFKYNIPSIDEMADDLLPDDDEIDEFGNEIDNEL